MGQDVENCRMMDYLAKLKDLWIKLIDFASKLKDFLKKLIDYLSNAKKQNKIRGNPSTAAKI